MAEALDSKPGDPMADPALATEKAGLRPKTESSVATPAEMAKAEVKADADAKVEEKKNAKVAVELAAEKAKEEVKAAEFEAKKKAEAEYI